MSSKGQLGHFARASRILTTDAEPFAHFIGLELHTSALPKPRHNS